MKFKLILLAIMSLIAQAAAARSIVAIIDMEYRQGTGIAFESSAAPRAKAFDSAMNGSGQSVIHGDAISSIVAGINPDTQILKLQIDGTYDGMVAAIDYLTGLPLGQRPQVVNISMVSNNPCTVRLARAINTAVSSGILVVTAIGNDALSVKPAPASCPGTISVGTNQHNSTKPASFSNISADAIYIDIDQSAIVPNWNPRFIGTSYSTAVVSGLVSIEPERFRTMSHAQLEQAIGELTVSYSHQD